MDHRRAATICGGLFLVILAAATAAVSAAPAAAVPLQAVRWPRVYAPTAAEDEWRDSAVGRDGSLYVAGTRGVGTSGADIVVARYRRGGSRLWVRRVKSRGRQQTMSLVVDRRGDASVVAGDSRGGGDIMIARVSAGGTLKWRVRYGSPGGRADFPYEMRADRWGRLYVAGYSDTAARNSDMLLLRYTRSGAKSWSFLFDYRRRMDWGIGLAVSTSGTSYMTGFSRGVGAEMAPLVCVGPDGKPDWSRIVPLDSNGIEEGRAVALRGTSLVVACDVSTMTTGDDVWVADYDTSGTLHWAKGWDSDDSDIAEEVAIDADGSVLVTGASSHAAGGALPLSRGFLLKYSPDGTPQWDQLFNDPAAPETGRAVFHDLALGGDGSAYCAGYVARGDDGDAVIVKYSATGAPVWSAPVDGGHGYDDFISVALGKASDGATLLYGCGFAWAANAYPDCLAARIDP